MISNISINKQWIKDATHTLEIAKEAYIKGDIGTLERANDDLIITLFINSEIAAELSKAIEIINKKYEKISEDIDKRLKDVNAYDKKRLIAKKDTLPFKRAAEVYLLLKRLVYKHLILQYKSL